MLARDKVQWCSQFASCVAVLQGLLTGPGLAILSRLARWQTSQCQPAVAASRPWVADTNSGGSGRGHFTCAALSKHTCFQRSYWSGLGPVFASSCLQECSSRVGLARHRPTSWESAGQRCGASMESFGCVATKQSNGGSFPESKFRRLRDPLADCKLDHQDSG